MPAARRDRCPRPPILLDQPQEFGDTPIHRHPPPNLQAVEVATYTISLLAISLNPPPPAQFSNIRNS